MSDQYTAIADRLVEAGIGTKFGDKYDWSTAWVEDWQKERMCKLSARRFCQDGRVVLAVMNLVEFLRVHDPDPNHIRNLSYRVIAQKGNNRTEVFHQSKAIAIIDACLSALEGRG